MAKKAKKAPKKAPKKAAPKAQQKHSLPKAPARQAQPAIGVQPLGDRVLVRPLQAETVTASGFVIPDTAKQEKPERGEVIAVGDGRRADDGTLMPMRVSVGDTVMFSKYGFDEITIDGVDYVIVSEPSILAILSK